MRTITTIKGIPVIINEIGDTWYRYENTGASGHYLGANLTDDELVKNANTCDFCNSEVGINNLHLVGFAQAACDCCVKEAKRKIEYCVWAD